MVLGDPEVGDQDESDKEKAAPAERARPKGCKNPKVKLESHEWQKIFRIEFLLLFFPTYLTYYCFVFKNQLSLIFVWLESIATILNTN